MLENLRPKLHRSWRKNRNELAALRRRTLPAFTRGDSLEPGSIPVFVFHDVEPEPFEQQLSFLQKNGYETLGTADFEASTEGRGSHKRSVLLTFDDATWTFWCYALPLLERFRMRAILFIIPALVPEDLSLRPTLADVWSGGIGAEDLAPQGAGAPLCTLGELRHIGASGLVEIGCHSATHSLVQTSPKVRDFIGPDFDPGRFANSDIPLSIHDDPLRPQRRKALGRPITAAASRLSGRPRWHEPLHLQEKLADRINREGGRSFFDRTHWRRQLQQVYRETIGRAGGHYESADETEASIVTELDHAQTLLQSLLPDTPMRHFCYPWFEGCSFADRELARRGYRYLHYGPDVLTRALANGGWQVQRLNEDWIWTLPGKNRRSFLDIMQRRLGR